jgi:phosphatidylglycerophosphate synthase
MNDNGIKEKAGKWLLKDVEDRLKNFIVPCLPGWIETYHLTWLTLVWSGLVVLFFYLGTENSAYYWYIPGLVILQYVTDLLDGSLGRYRDTGLVKWGYYVDHFLDFVFMCSIIFGYALVAGFNVWFFLLLALASGFMVHAFLLVSTNGEFQISLFGLGPTEGRVMFIILHIVILIIGIEIVEVLLPYVVGLVTLFLVYAFLASQVKLWRIDMSIKNKKV